MSLQIKSQRVLGAPITNSSVTAVRAQSTALAKVPLATGVTAPVNRPANPALILYGGTTGSVSSWAQPGALIVAGRDNYNNSEVHTMADGGATVIVYLDLVINNSFGRYHDKLINSSEFGAAVPLWPGGPWVANSFGSLNDFRSGGILQNKLRGVMELILSENPHVAGFFLDDLGTRSWFPDFSWTAFPDKEAYRAGAIAACQTARAVCDEQDCFVMVNGTWGANPSTTVGDGGYPVRNTHGCSIVDGGFVENHDYDAYWQGYMSSTQWGSATPRNLGYNWASNVGNTTQRDNYVNANVTAFASTNDYSAGVVAPWRGFTNFGLPNRA